MLVVLVGLKGSGKTTLMKKVLEKRPEIKHIIAGDYFAKYYEEKGLNRDQGDLGIDPSEHSKIQREIFKRIKSESKKHKHTIVDTHGLLTKKEGFYPGLPINVLEELMPDVIAALEFKPEEILKRREKDVRELDRKRSAAVTLDGVKTEYDIQRNYLCSASMMIGCTVKLLQRFEPESYEFEHVDKNTEELLDLFD